MRVHSLISPVPSTLFIACLVFGVLPSGAHGQARQSDLREYVRNQLDAGQLELSEPTFEDSVDFQGRPIIRYTLGGRPGKQDFGDDFDDPTQIALGAQMQVEAIRQYRNTPAQRDWWRPTLASVESEIEGILADAAQLNGEELQEALSRRTERISRIYKQALDRSARTEGKHSAEQGGQHYGDYIRIRISASPGGNVSIIPAGQWELYDFLARKKGRENIQKPNWTTVAAGEDQRVGKGCRYWFRVEWHGGGTTRYNDAYTINSDSDLRLTRNGPQVVRRN